MDPLPEPFSVLFIDDTEGCNTIQIQELFSKAPSHPAHFDISKTPADAVEKLRRNRYSLILTKSSFQAEENTKELLSEIRRRGMGAPVILLVRPEEEDEARRAVTLGAADYLVKHDNGSQKLMDQLWNIYRNHEFRSSPPDFETEVALQNQKLLETNKKLGELSIRDPLTGLYNHRFLQERVVEEFNRAMRHHRPLSCILVDLDHFRQINETWGHAVGDEILKESAEILNKSSRLSDLVARFGGEEFIILLPEVDYQGAIERGDRLRELFAKHTFLADSHAISVTASIGISSFPEDSIKHRSELFNFADQALFRAKSGGRNRVSLYRDIIPTLAETLPHLKISSERVLEFQRKLSEIADRARRGYIESSRAMIKALESKDHFTAGHSVRVAKLSLQAAETLGLSLDEAEVIEHAGLLHDIGKICISDDILLKPARLTFTEYEAMKQHAYLGYRILKPIKFLQEEATLVLHHHEWFNGEGYPCHLVKNEIPIGARIISVVDSYDTMRHAGGRYKKTVAIEAAVNELIACAGSQFDPEVVRVFIQVLLMSKELSPDAYDRKRLKQAVEASQIS